MRLADKVAELARVIRRAEQELISGLSDEERDATGTSQVWAARPIYAHIVDFKLQQVQRLEALARGMPPPRFPHLDRSEPAVHAAYCAKPWEALEAEGEQVFADFERLVVALSDAELADQERFPWLGGRPLCHQVMFRGVWHPMTDMQEHYEDTGNHEAVASLRGGLTEALIRLEFEPVPGDTVSYYNLACLYATSGRRDAALALLPEALSDPVLAAYAPGDPDLARLRDELDAYMPIA